MTENTCPQCRTALSNASNCAVCGWTILEITPEQNAQSISPSKEGEQSAPLTEQEDSQSKQEDALNTPLNEKSSVAGQSEPRPLIEESLPQSNTAKIIADEIEDVSIVQGANNTLRKEINHFYFGIQKSKEVQESIAARFSSATPGDFKEKRETKLSFIEASEPLPPARRRTESLTTASQEYIDSLKENHLLLISCSNEDIAFDAARSLVDGFDISEATNKRLLSFERLGLERNDVSLYSFSFGDKQPSEVTIIIDTTSKRGETFADSLLNTPLSLADKILEELKDINLFLISLIDSKRIDRWINEGKKLRFSHWRIPYQESKIAAPPIDFNLKFSESDTVSKTILYTAAFFPDLALQEFNQVVTTLLVTDQAVDQSVSLRPTEPSVSSNPTVTHEKSLIQVWREKGDDYLRNNGLTLAISKASRRVVTFTQPSMRESFIENWTELLPFDLINKLATFRNKGLLFEPSDNIAKHARYLIAQAAADYPDDFDRRWFITVIRCIEKKGYSALTQNLLTTKETEMLGPAGGDMSPNFFYSRLADLLREMLGYPKLTKLVNDLLEQLMREGLTFAVLSLVRRLQYALNFDDFYWLKQLLERSDEHAYPRTYNYLYNRVKNADANLYELLEKLRDWLPKDGRDPRSYPRSAQATFQILIEYCIETAYEFKEDLYGLWPSSYPLFKVGDADAADKSLSLLAEWLTHSGSSFVFYKKSLGDDYNDFLSALIAQWVVILKGSSEEAEKKRHDSNNAEAVEDDAAENKESDLDVYKMQAILLKQFAAHTEQPEQRHLSAAWEKLKADFNTSLDMEIFTGRERRIIVWHRKLISQLIEQFKAETKHVRELRPTLTSN